MQGVPLPLSEWEREILPRVSRFDPAALDALMAAGEVVWVGRGALGRAMDGLALYLADSLSGLLPPVELQEAPRLEGRAQRVAEFLAVQGTSFFSAVHEAAGGGFPRGKPAAHYATSWQGIVTNDTFLSLRGFLYRSREGQARGGNELARPGSVEFLKQFRSRSRAGAIAQGRWSLVRSRVQNPPSPTQWSAGVAQQLLLRYGVVMRESAAAEELPGGFSAIYPALRQMEERGWVRRGMFISGLGGSQFALAAAVESLRALRSAAKRTAITLSAVDPANPYGNLLPWPRLAEAEDSMQTAHGMARTSGASVVLVDGDLVAYLRRGNPSLKLFLPATQPERDGYAP